VTVKQRPIELDPLSVVQSYCHERRGGCGAPILWAEVRTTKRNMPVDPDPNPKGNLLINGERYMPHWATCPNADRFKREKTDP
jgi:hypothetical protein